MPGSSRDFVYTDDDGNAWNCKVDESTYEQAVLGFISGVNDDARTARRKLKMSGKQQPVVPRYAIAKGLDVDGRTVTRKLYVGSISATAWVNPSAAAAALELPDYSDPSTSQFLTDVEITSLVGERRNFPPGGDTGIIDGDVESYTPPPP